MTSPAAFAAAVMETAAIAPEPQVTSPAPSFDPAMFAIATVVVVEASRPGRQGGGGGGNNNRNYNRNRGRNNQPTEIPKGAGYCWSHGYTPQHGADPHCSGNCQNRKPGHKKVATVENKMGGKTHIWIDN